MRRSPRLTLAALSLVVLLAGWGTHILLPPPREPSEPSNPELHEPPPVAQATLSPMESLAPPSRPLEIANQPVEDKIKPAVAPDPQKLFEHVSQARAREEHFLKFTLNLSDVEISQIHDIQRMYAPRLRDDVLEGRASFPADSETFRKIKQEHDQDLAKVLDPDRFKALMQFRENEKTRLGAILFPPSNPPSRR